MRAATVLREIPIEPQPEIHVGGEGELRRHDPDDDVVAVHGVELPADDPGIGAIAVPPQAIADHRNRIARVERTVLRKPGAQLR